MATDKTPTHGERIEALEEKVAKIMEALASGDPTLIAQAFAK